MKIRCWWYCAFFMLTSLFIYVFYRTEQTLINKIITIFISKENYIAGKIYISTYIPLPAFIVASLPEGLWVFCTTIASQNIVLKVGKIKMYCIYFPIVFAYALEYCQLLKIRQGTFDGHDLFFATIFWLLAFSVVISFKKSFKYSIFSLNGCIFLVSFAMVYFAHVI